MLNCTQPYLSTTRVDICLFLLFIFYKYLTQIRDDFRGFSSPLKNKKKKEKGFFFFYPRINSTRGRRSRLETKFANARAMSFLK